MRSTGDTFILAGIAFFCAGITLHAPKVSQKNRIINWEIRPVVPAPLRNKDCLAAKIEESKNPCQREPNRF